MRKFKVSKERKAKEESIRAEIWNNFDFDQTLAKFAIDEPFYSHICSNINKYATDKLDTAGVTLENENFVLYYNEDFFNSLNWLQRQGLLIHEFMHIVFGHVTSRAKYEKNGKPDKAWLHACDYAINSLIPENKLPPGGLIPGKMADIPLDKKHLYSQEYLEAYDRFKLKVREWPKGKSSEWYYKEIIKDRKDFDVIAGGMDSFDNHEGWSEVSSEEAEILKDKIQKLAEDAVDICEKNNKWGSISAKLKKELRNIAKGTISWVDLLRMFVGNNLVVHKTSSIKKINKRYPYIHPGKKRHRIARVVVCIDQSGSVDNKSLAKFFGELENLSEMTEFVVVPFDSKVIKEKIFTWKKGEKLAATRVASGGTNFDVPTKWVNQKFSEFDAALFMTDGYCSKPIDCKIPRAWIICKKGKLLFDTNEIVIKMDY